MPTNRSGNSSRCCIAASSEWRRFARNASQLSPVPSTERSAQLVLSGSAAFGSDEGDEIALPLPGGGLAQRRDQVVVGLRPRRRTGAILQRTGDKDHGVAGHRKLALAALAPQFEHDLAVVADLQVRQSLRSGLTRRVQRHLIPNGNPSSARSRDRRSADRRTPRISATAARLTKPVTAKTCSLSKIFRSARCSNRQASDIDQIGRRKFHRLAKKIPAGSGRGDFVGLVRNRSLLQDHQP